MSGLSPFGVSVLVPSLAAISQYFNASLFEVQFLVSAYLLGLGVAQPVCGYLCDKYGRRIVMLVGFSIFVLTNIIAAFATDLSFIILLRFLQAVGVSVGTVTSRAIVRDTRSAEKSAEAMSYIAAAMGLAPVIAPVIGGSVAGIMGFRGVFVVSAVAGSLLLVWAFFRLPETLDRSRIEQPKMNIVESYGVLLRSRAFVGYTLMFGFIQGSFFAFLAVGALLFESEFNLGPVQFGTIWSAMAGVYVAGALLGGRFTRHFGSRKTVQAAVWVTFVTGFVYVALVYALPISLPLVIVPLLFLMCASGSVTPGVMAGAVNCRPDIAGTSSGFFSALGIVIAGLFSVATGTFYDGDYRPVVLLMAFATSVTALCWLMVVVAENASARRNETS